MAHVIFYEKEGCAGNAKQKQLLKAAGHTVTAHNLLTHEWQADELRLFFGTLPVAEWFNVNAPAVKYGEIDIDVLNEEQALALMMETPLLIRRPLMQVDNEHMAGFEAVKVDAWIGLRPENARQDVESCPRSAHHSETCRHV